MYIKNRLLLFWKIGKYVYEKQNKYENVIAKCSNACSYYFGNSYLFSRSNIRFMKCFYLCFPIFYDELAKISWEQYIELFNMQSREEFYFYFYLSMFFNSSLGDTKEFIENNYFLRI